jgi:hypothetical protein
MKTPSSRMRIRIPPTSKLVAVAKSRKPPLIRVGRNDSDTTARPLQVEGL